MVLTHRPGPRHHGVPEEDRDDVQPAYRPVKTCHRRHNRAAQEAPLRRMPQLPRPREHPRPHPGRRRRGVHLHLPLPQVRPPLVDLLVLRGEGRVRIRSTKPEFWRSERIAALSWDARLVLKGLESYVDDNGVGKDDISLIVTDVFPRDLVASPRETVARVSEAI